MALYLLLDEQSYQEQANSTEDGEDEDDTWLLCCPVLALHELVDSDLAAGNQRHVEGGHC
jgi:hypothetical protein